MPDAASPTPPSPDPSRRGLLGFAASLVGGAAALVVGIPGLRYLLTPVLRRAEAQWVELGDATELGALAAPRELRFQYEARTGYVLARRTGLLLLVPQESAESGLVAYSAVCSHKACNVSWDTDEELFACPCHAGRFALDGAPAGGPPSEPLRGIALEAREGRLWAEIPEGAI